MAYTLLDYICNEFHRYSNNLFSLRRAFRRLLFFAKSPQKKFQPYLA